MANAIPQPLLDLRSATAAHGPLPNPPHKGEGIRPGAAREAAESFEAVFLFEILQGMYAGVEPGPFGGGSEETLYRSMMHEEVAKSIARTGGVGIADAVYREIMRVQEV